MYGGTVESSLLVDDWTKGDEETGYRDFHFAPRTIGGGGVFTATHGARPKSGPLLLVLVLVLVLDDDDIAWG